MDSFRLFRKGIAAKRFCAMTMPISPKLAKEMLKRNRKNRRYVDGRAEKLADDMRDKKWRRTGEAISFKRDGKLLSGQHRLNAVIKSNTTQEFNVAFCADDDATLYEGMGIRFTPNDHLARNGFSQLSSKNGGAVIRHMLHAFSNPRGSMRPEQVIAMAKKYKEPITFATDLFSSIKNKRIAIAPVVAVIARAAHALPSKRSQIKQFCEVLRDGLRSNPEERDRLPISLRDALIQQRNHKAADICQVYRKTETALMRFLKNADIKSPLYGTREELFPIPEDDIAEGKGNRFFCVPGKALSLTDHSLSTGAVKSLVKKGVLSFTNKRMTQHMKPGDKVCVMGFDGRGVRAKAMGVIKRVNRKGKGVSVVLKDAKIVRGPLLGSIRSSLSGFKKEMPIRLFAGTTRTIRERDYKILTAE